MIESRGVYRSIMKGTAIFGGVQIFNILINLVRGKFIALFLGPPGMGVYALLNSTVNTISQLSSFGLNMSAVKDISRAHQEENLSFLSKVVRIFRKLVLFTGFLGGGITIIISPWLSKFAFGNESYTFAFVFLSIMVLFTSLTNGEVALLQGTRKLRELANSTIIGSLTGLIIGVPLYYFWREKGIAPAMVIFAVVTYIANRFFARKIVLIPEKVNLKDTFHEGRQMFSLGLALTISNVIGSATIYFVNTYISRFGNIADLGLYQAATSITNQYVGLVFSAMAVDYFPRLASIANDNKKVREMANQQMEIVTLLIVPLLILLIITSPLVIRILLAKDFLPIIPLLRIMGMGLFFKALAFPMGYISFAKGDKYTFFLLEGVGGNLLNLISGIICYRKWGLEGLGISFVFAFVVYLIVIFIVTRLRYDYHFDMQVKKIFFPSLFFIVLTFLLFTFFDGVVGYSISLILLCFSSVYSYRELNKRLDICNLLRSKFCKKS